MAKAKEPRDADRLFVANILDYDGFNRFFSSESAKWIRSLDSGGRRAWAADLADRMSEKVGDASGAASRLLLHRLCDLETDELLTRIRALRPAPRPARTPRRPRNP